MSSVAQDLLIVYESEAKQWAAYLRSVFTGPIREGGICCYDIATVTKRREDFLRLGQYKVKLLILSTGMLEGMCPLRRFFLSHALKPAASVVVLLCGVDSLEPLLELVPLSGDECLQISSEQDAQDYLSAVTDIVRTGHLTTTGTISAASGRQTRPELNLKLEGRQSISANLSNILVIPSRVPCGTPGYVYLILKDTVAREDAEVVFNGTKNKITVKPVHWNKHVLCVSAADFPAGSVELTLNCSGVAIGKAHLQYYSVTEEISRLLTRVANPVLFMCQALQVSSVEKLDQRLTSMLLKALPSTGLQGLQEDDTPVVEPHLEEVPSLLHFAAQNGLKDLSRVLLQCPGAKRALCTANSRGQTPARIAQHHGHTELHVLLQQSLNVSTSDKDSEDASVSEMMGAAAAAIDPTLPLNVFHQYLPGTPVAPDATIKEQEELEELYTPLGLDDEEYDTIFTSSGNVAIANRPPAPTPRPETAPDKGGDTLYIAKVFQKNKAQGNAETLYSHPARPAHLQDGIASAYDTFVPSRTPGLEHLIELQEKVKRGALSMDEALERFSAWQSVQKDVDAIQQAKLRQLRESVVSNREDDASVYDKINIIHHTPNVNKGHKGSQPVETDFYSKPLKGQHSTFFWKADKR